MKALGTSRAEPRLQAMRGTLEVRWIIRDLGLTLESIDGVRIPWPAAASDKTVQDAMHAYVPFPAIFFFSLLPPSMTE